MSGFDPADNPIAGPSRIDVVRNDLRWRQWTTNDKARIVAEAVEPGAVVCDVARRYGVRPQQVLVWRREARDRARHAALEEQGVAPIVVDASMPAVTASRPPGPRRIQISQDGGEVDLEIDGIAMRVGRHADVRTIASIVRMLKATR